MPAARALSSPSGESAMDNVVERENLGAGGITGNGWTDRRGIWNSSLDIAKISDYLHLQNILSYI